MKLAIDTSNIHKIIIKFDDHVFKTEARREKSQTLLSFIEQKMADLKLSFSDISEIEVAEGPGSFTGLRVGLSVAQTLSWMLRVPLNGKQIDKGEQVTLSYN